MQVYLMGGGGGLKGGGLSMLGRKHCSFNAKNVRECEGVIYIYLYIYISYTYHIYDTSYIPHMIYILLE